MRKEGDKEGTEVAQAGYGQIEPSRNKAGVDTDSGPRVHCVNKKWVPEDA